MQGAWCNLGGSQLAAIGLTVMQQSHRVYWLLPNLCDMLLGETCDKESFDGLPGLGETRLEMSVAAILLKCRDMASHCSTCKPGTARQFCS